MALLTCAGSDVLSGHVAVPLVGAPTARLRLATADAADGRR
jgi:hypothetical protein